MSDFRSSTSGVADSLSKLQLTTPLLAFLVARKSEWSTFGKMSSHLYRERLMKLMANNKLSAESQFMVFFLFCVIKNQPKVVSALQDMDKEAQAQSWYKGTLEFIQTNVTQYVTDVGNTKKMPAVNIPSCNPGFDILVYSLITDPKDKSVSDVSNRPTFCQLHLSDDVQTSAKEGYANYWNNIVKGTKNTTKKEEPMMRDQYYKTAASDSYFLVDKNLKEIPPKNSALGYTREEIIEYLKNTFL